MDVTAALPSVEEMVVTDSSFSGNNSGTTSNHTSLDSFYFYEVEQLTFLCIMFAVIVCANSLLLGSLLSAQSRKSRTNFFIMHLALADLSVGLISVVTDVVWKFTVEWYADGVTCKIVKYLQVLVTFSSTYVLVALSIDRCDAILHPMRFIGSWRRARMLVVGAWTVSAIFATPMLVLYDVATQEGKTQCWINLGEPDSVAWRLYLLLISLALFIIPALIIISCYSIILWTLWRKGRILKTPKDIEERRFARIGGKPGRRRPEECDLRRASSRGLIPKAKIKTIKMTFYPVLEPYIVFDLLQVFGHLPHTQTMLAVATFIQSLAPLNSAANPIIYISFSNSVCRNLRRFAVVEWLSRRLPWCPCAVAEGNNTDSTFRHGTDFTTMSESRSRSAHARSTLQRSNLLRNYGAATSGCFSEISLQRGGATAAVLSETPSVNGVARV